ncbi:MAG: GTPase [Candidatus Micrarchaeota archaeon]
MPDFRKKTFSQVYRLLRRCDLAIEVVDARDIEGTRMTNLDREFRSKVVVVASKADLIAKKDKKINSFDGSPVIFFSSRTRDGLAEIFREITSRREKRRLKTVKLVIFGIPNVGKSSLINAIRGKHSTATGFRSGITRGPQWIKVKDGILLFDTPGVIGLTASDDELALKAAVNVENLKDPEKVAIKLLLKFEESKNNSLLLHYGAESSPDPQETLASIAKKRGILLKGGEPNSFEAAKVVLRDFQKGKFVL